MATCSGGQPPGAGPPTNQNLSSPTNKDDLESLKISAKPQGPGLKTMAEAVKNSSRGPTNMRSFAQILEQEKKDRNILELRINKIRTDEAVPPPLNSNNMLAEDVGELLFDILKLNPAHCLAYDYNTGRNDTKQVKLKPGIPVADILAKSPLEFKGFKVVVSQQRLNITRVTFKNVPLNVPDEEIIHLCMSYGSPVENKVQYEVLRNSRNKGHTGSTRFVDMELNEDSSFNNYYWMEGPFPGDQGRRVLVLHSGQAQQCSNCLKIGPNCPAAGNGKLCKDEFKTPREKMSVYMNSLKITQNYTSLKTQYLESQVRKYPQMGGGIASLGVNDMDSADSAQSDQSNSSEERDSKIKTLQESLIKANESVKTKDELIASLEQKQKEEVARWKDKLSTAQKKVNSVYSGSARKLLKDVTDVSTPIMTEDFDNTCKLLAVSFYDTNLSEEDVDRMNSESAPLELLNDVFKPFRDQVDLTDSVQAERLSRVKNKVVENLKTTIRSRSRRMSLGSVSPASKRGNSEGERSDENPSKLADNRPSPKKDKNTVSKSGLPQYNKK